MSRIALRTNDFRTVSAIGAGRRLRRATAAATLSVLTVLGSLLAGATPALAEQEEKRQAAPDPWDAFTQALVVGSTAFVMIIGLAGAVLYYTAKGHRRQTQPH
ncbi:MULTISPECIES: hypothetical protein [Prauserella salsuginis group]|uniref:ABC-type Fe3+ transport system permease subunit n=2 Tax=Prauserella salsuginis group TaxID=2893672 RepID=A0A839XMH2_9PSEU|nr:MULTISPECIES: hypothetical protein [Prauserella salsuginis group]MBB3663837.1 ABC-type Fe3+ transport system permease subunit [Prauserella sediminis]MCR3722381.1 hypothetical protein [Prauserella flava]MCR3736823.1 hypothetical protein [Prauserella salsuginis]